MRACAGSVQLTAVPTARRRASSLGLAGQQCALGGFAAAVSRKRNVVGGQSACEGCGALQTAWSSASGKLVSACACRVWWSWTHVWQQYSSIYGASEGDGSRLGLPLCISDNIAGERSTVRACQPGAQRHLWRAWPRN